MVRINPDLRKLISKITDAFGGSFNDVSGMVLEEASAVPIMREDSGMSGM